MNTLGAQFQSNKDEETASYWKALGKILEPLARPFSKEPGKILVMDGNGAVGYRVAKLLLAAGYDHNKLIIATDELHDIPDLAAAAEVVMFDWDGDEYHYAEVLKDVRTVFCVPPDTVVSRQHMTGKFAKFLSKARAAGVKHFVKLSSYHALAKPEDPTVDFEHTDRHDDPYQKVQLVKDHGVCDEMLLHCPTLDYTILFATHLASDPLRFQKASLEKDHKFCGASGGDKGVNYISPNDVAEFAVRVMLNPKDHIRTGYTLTAPQATTDTEVANLLSKKFGKTVVYEEVPLNKFSKDHGDLELIKSTGWEERDNFISKDFDKVVGHAGQTYEQYLKASEMFSPKEQLRINAQTAQ